MGISDLIDFQGDGGEGERLVASLILGEEAV